MGGTFCSPEPNSAQESLGRALRSFPGHCHRLSWKCTLSSPNSPLGSNRSMRGHLPSWPHLLVTTQEVELGKLDSFKKRLLRGCGHIFRVPEALAPTFTPLTSQPQGCSSCHPSLPAPICPSRSPLGPNLTLPTSIHTTVKKQGRVRCGREGLDSQHLGGRFRAGFMSWGPAWSA